MFNVHFALGPADFVAKPDLGVWACLGFNFGGVAGGPVGIKNDQIS